jgi:NAD(P)-dependent dehydrogenase (short-subunit alcohol dehydrogenase family)
MNIVITGTSRGIGLELAAQALKKGHRVLAVARKPDESAELKALKTQYSSELELAAVDVTQAEASERIAHAAAAWPCVDVLINNAGVYRQGDSREDLLASFETNTIAPFLITRALFPQLRKSSQPKAIQITSLMGSIGDNGSGGAYAYRASKAALNMLTKCIAVDEPWLIAAVVHPGWVQTRMGGSGAPTPVQESASGIWRVIEGLAKQDSGAFVDYEGERLPW